jgi:hypothetical protein
MNRCGRLALVYRGVFAASLLALVGCGDDELSDDFYGPIDLAPYFFDGSTAAAPDRGLPREIRPSRGWFNGLRVEYYDFGLVSHRRRRNAGGTTLAEPDIAFVNPIYFFFDSKNQPMFSKPIYEWRTGVFYMRGGENALNPNPADPPAEESRRRGYYDLAYSARARTTIWDAARGSDDYQRPIVDVLNGNANYTGLWEIIEVIASDGYKPDSIKSLATLQAGIDSGKLSTNRTQKVINCPVVDDRTFVSPSPMAIRMKSDPARQEMRPFFVPHPRVEIWYRTKLGSCYLANGWETLGETAIEGNREADPRDPKNLTLFPAKIDPNRRLDTFDVIRYAVGEGNNQVLSVVVPAGKIYIPKVTISTLNPSQNNYDLRYFGDDITPSIPRHFESDPPGYSPITWLWDITVPQDPPYASGSFKGLNDVDPMATKARDFVNNNSPVWTRNYPVVGVASPCKGNQDCPGFDRQCNVLPDLDLATADPPPGKNLADVMIEREGGPRCDAPAVGYGQYCAPAIARCESQVPAVPGTGGAKSSWELLQAMKVGAAGPNLQVHAPAANALKAWNDAKPVQDGIINNPASTPEQQMAARAELTRLENAYNTAKARADSYAAKGYTTDLANQGYVCQPPAGTANVYGGYCYIRCDGGASRGSVPADDPTRASGTTVKRMLEVPDARVSNKLNMKEFTFQFDAQCGGTELLGYRCLPSSGRTEKQRVCVRECSTRNTENDNTAICTYPVNDGLGKKAPDTGKATDYSFYAGQPATQKFPGQTCNNLGGVTACTWNPDFEPRSEASMWPPPQ